MDTLLIVSGGAKSQVHDVQGGLPAKLCLGGYFYQTVHPQGVYGYWNSLLYVSPHNAWSSIRNGRGIEAQYVRACSHPVPTSASYPQLLRSTCNL